MMLEAVSPPSSSSEDFVIVSKSANNDKNGKQRRRLQQTDKIANDDGSGGGEDAAAVGVDEEIAATAAAVDSPNNLANSGTSQKRQQQQQQRSLLQTLWSEATSTTELHQRRRRRVRKVGGGGHSSINNRQDDNDDYSPSSFKSSSKQQQRRSDGGKKYNKGHHYNYNYNNNNRRAKRLATQVWLAVFAVLAIALLVKIHMFLYYKVFLSNNGNKNNNKNDANRQQEKSEGIDNKQHEIVGVDSDTLQRLLDNHNIDVEDTTSKMTLEDAHSHQLTPLPLPSTSSSSSSNNNSINNIDTTQYTIRMNTWHRNEQLLLSINHHSQCEGVAEIQIVWCDTHNDPPDDIVHHHSGKVKVERHTINSLNERFKIILDTPTLGILSLDDDVLRPCEALDAAFLRWVRHPDRMVGFDVRTHVVEELDEEEGGGGGGRGGGNAVEGIKEQGDNKTKKRKTNWKYGYMSTTEKSNSYSLSLPRASFLHKDYLDLYIMAIPRPIYLYVAQHFECEDIAMSFFISSLTHGAPPLITDYWAVKSMVKLYSESKISGGKDHKSSRDKCVDTFAELLGVKEDGRWGPLHKAELIHVNKKNDDEEEEGGDGRMFGYGSEPEDWDTIDESSISSTRLKELLVTMKELKHKSYNEQMKWLKKKKYQTMKEAKKVGMIENTSEWEKRWKNGGGEEE